MYKEILKALAVESTPTFLQHVAKSAFDKWGTGGRLEGLEPADFLNSLVEVERKAVILSTLDSEGRAGTWFHNEYGVWAWVNETIYTLGEFGKLGHEVADTLKEALLTRRIRSMTNEEVAIRVQELTDEYWNMCGALMSRSSRYLLTVASEGHKHSFLRAIEAVPETQEAMFQNASGFDEWHRRYKEGKKRGQTDLHTRAVFNMAQSYANLVLLHEEDPYGFKRTRLANPKLSARIRLAETIHHDMTGEKPVTDSALYEQVEGLEEAASHARKAVASILGLPGVVSTGVRGTQQKMQDCVHDLNAALADMKYREL